MGGPVGLRRLLREELIRGVAVNILFIGAQAAVGLLAAVIAARHLGPEGVGIVAIGLLIAEFVSVVDNLPSHGFVRDQASGASRAKVATVLGTKGAIGLAATLLILLASPLIARGFDVPLAIPVIFAFIPTASIVSSVALMAWEAQRDMARRNATQLAEAITRLVLYSLVAFAVTLPLSAEVSISLATLAASAAASVVGALIIPSLSLRNFELARAKDYLRFGLRTQGTGAMQKLIFWFDIVLIDVFLGHAVQGLYKTSYTLMSYLTLATGAVSIMMYPTIASALAAGEVERTRRTFSLGAIYSLLIALPFVLLFVTVPEFLLVTLMGEAFLPAAWMLRALGIVGLVAAVLVPFETYFPAIGRPDLGLRVAAAQVTTNVVLDLLLIPRLGVAGAIVASGATFAVGLVTAVVLLRRIGHSLPRLGDLKGLWAEPVPSPPETPPRL